MAQLIIVRPFVSSTWLDLRPERDAVETLLQRFRETKYIGMEHFGSRSGTTRQTSLIEVDRSDLYIGIIGGRYGLSSKEFTPAMVVSIFQELAKEKPDLPPELVARITGLFALINQRRPLYDGNGQKLPGSRERGEVLPRLVVQGVADL